MSAPQQSRQSQRDCPICLTALQKGAALFTTSCGHVFHFDCLKQSVQHANWTCPLCRTAMPELVNIFAAAPPTRPEVTILPPPSDLNIAYHPFIQQPQRVQANNHRLQRPVAIAPVVDMTEDDLPPPIVRPGVQMTVEEERPTLTVSAQTLYSQVAHTEATNMKAMVSVVAGTSTASAEPRARENGVDLVAVVDKSGSMSGSKIELLKMSLKFLVSQLTPQDRLSIIAFDHTPNPLCGLKSMTETRKAEMMRLIDTISAGGGTTIHAAFASGLQVLRNRRQTNSLSAMLMMTDGQDGSSRTMIEPIWRRESEHVHNCRVFTFGYGADHDVDICTLLADIGHGTFSYVETTNDLGPAVAAVTGGLLSVVGQGITLTISPIEGSGISFSRAHTFFTCTVNNGSVVVTIPDLYEGEKRDILLDCHCARLETPVPEPAPMASLSVSYKAAPSFDTLVTAVGTMDLARPEPGNITDTHANPELEVEGYRVDTANIIQSAMDLSSAGQYADAKAMLDTLITSIRASAQFASHTILQGLVQQLEECKQRVQPQEYARGGRAYMASAQRQMAQQRSAGSNMMYSNIGSRGMTSAYLNSDYRG